MLNQGVVTLAADLTSTGTATTVTAPKLVSPETTSIGKTTLSALSVGALRQISVAANLIVGSFPTKSFCLAGDATVVALPSTAAFVDAFEIQADAGTTSRREWSLVVNPYTLAGGDGAKYALLSDAQKAAFDNQLKPWRATMTLEQAIALCLDNQPDDKAAIVTFDQTTNKLKVGYGSEANLDTYIGLVDAIVIAADKQVVGFNFADVVVADVATGSDFLE